jgi:hypothetical protein
MVVNLEALHTYGRLCIIVSRYTGQTINESADSSDYSTNNCLLNFIDDLYNKFDLLAKCKCETIENDCFTILIFLV